MPEVAWLTCFLDHGPGVHEPATAFWAAATGCTPSSPRGEHDEFATLLPAQGDPHVRVQRLDTGASGVHLDLHAADHEGIAVEHARPASQALASGSRKGQGEASAYDQSEHAAA